MMPEIEFKSHRFRKNAERPDNRGVQHFMRQDHRSRWSTKPVINGARAIRDYGSFAMIALASAAEFGQVVVPLSSAPMTFRM
jgi:hypothetical protein